MGRGGDHASCKLEHAPDLQLLQAVVDAIEMPGYEVSIARADNQPITVGR